jgi:hypothetical protein
MPVTILATVGDANANSFVTEAEAIAYAEERLNLTGWTTVAGIVCTENEKKALIAATRELDTLRFVGYRASTAQALSWPRTYAPRVDTPYAVADEGLYDLVGTATYAENEIPAGLKAGTIELAFEFLRAGSTDISRADSNRGLIRKKVDVLESAWEPGARLSGLARFPNVLRTVSPLLATRGYGVIRT